MQQTQENNSKLLLKILPPITLSFILIMFIATSLLLFATPKPTYDSCDFGFYILSTSAFIERLTVGVQTKAIVLTIFAVLSIISVFFGYYINKKYGNVKGNKYFLITLIISTLTLVGLLIVGFMSEPSPESVSSLIFKQPSGSMPKFTYTTAGIILVVVDALIGASLIITTVLWSLKTFKNSSFIVKS